MSEIKVYCSNCNTEYEVPEEMLGQEAECAVCNQTFVVETRQEEEETEGTNTVKISRSGIGMMPTVEDTFRVNLVDTPTASPSGKIVSDEEEAETEEAAEEKPAKKGWKFWKK